jgi:hypothetical protein
MTFVDGVFGRLLDKSSRAAGDAYALRFDTHVREALK